MSITEPEYFPELPKLDRILRAINELGNLNPADGAGWELRKLRWYRDALFENFAPFKVGDQVVMHTAYAVEQGSGWKGYEGMMHRGATGVVVEVDWTARSFRRSEAKPGEGDFSTRIVFDHQWYVSSFDGTSHEIPDEDRTSFWFNDPERWWTNQELTSLPGHEEVA